MHYIKSYENQGISDDKKYKNKLGQTRARLSQLIFLAVHGIKNESNRKGVTEKISYVIGKRCVK